MDDDDQDDLRDDEDAMMDDEDEPRDEEDADEEEDEDATAEPDDKKAIKALEAIGARIDRNKYGNAWRVFLYQNAGDPQLTHMLGLHSLRELWLLGTRCSKDAAEELRREMPNTRVFI